MRTEFDANTVSRLLNDSLASKVVHKEMFISAERLAGVRQSEGNATARLR